MTSSQLSKSDLLLLILVFSYPVTALLIFTKLKISNLGKWLVTGLWIVAYPSILFFILSPYYLLYQQDILLLSVIFAYPVTTILLNENLGFSSNFRKKTLLGLWIICYPVIMLLIGYLYLKIIPPQQNLML